MNLVNIFGGASNANHILPAISGKVWFPKKIFFYTFWLQIVENKKLFSKTKKNNDVSLCLLRAYKYN